MAYEPTGICFALAYSTVTNGTENFIKLFDSRNYHQGPFITWRVTGPEIKGIEFSADGKKLLAYTTESSIMILDAISGNTKHVIRDFGNDSGKVMATFSPCSKYIVTGCERINGIVVYDVENGDRVHEFKGHPRVPSCIGWSREHILMASACQNLLFWVPDLAKL